jgi:hypothetical protein
MVEVMYSPVRVTGRVLLGEMYPHGRVSWTAMLAKGDVTSL